MIHTAIILLIALITVSAGLMAGVYFAFSSFIMRSLDQLGPVQGAAAMNAINRVILRSWFMPLFFASSLLSLGLIVVALLDQGLNGRGWLILMGSLYVLGMFLTTAIRNVPLNDQLAAVENHNDAEVADRWNRYYHHWTRWNHLRSISCLFTTVVGVYYLTALL